jgi:hypothetical protein
MNDEQKIVTPETVQPPKDAFAPWAIMDDQGNPHPLTWKDCSRACRTAISNLELTLLEKRIDGDRAEYAKRDVKILVVMRDRFLEAHNEAILRGTNPGRRHR